jgi:hypothetical protein
MPRKNFLILGTVIAALVIAVVSLTVYIFSTAGDDHTQTVDKNGSIETAISVQHADSTHDVILTSHRVWVRDSTYAVFVHRDTIPALDSMYAETENKNGDNKLVEVKKDYQLFITVK